MYSIKELSAMAGVSSRTLRYYDSIGLLRPSTRTTSGVRMYDGELVDQLQRILFFKTLEVPLKEIKKIMSQSFDEQLEQLHLHQEAIKTKIDALKNLDRAISISINMIKEDVQMEDTEKFRSFKETQLAQNEVNFGKEIRAKYGDQAVEQSNANYLNLTEKQFKQAEDFEKDLSQRLQNELNHEKDSENRRQIFQDHQGWLKLMAGKKYSKEYHHNLGLMYQADDRFQKYYDDLVGEPGAGMLLAEIILEN